VPRAVRSISFLPEPARDVVFRFLLRRFLEHHFGAIEFDELAIRKNPVSSATRAACCMLWVTITIVH
jgi:hypothetical protein